mmetsp:Transcript_30327/g.73785  ORF Transcript_30327/g.73785 Transcript_30327/m.73785 type:complete len:124 (+) Transcript_30327:405-776(+)
MNTSNNTIDTTTSSNQTKDLTTTKTKDFGNPVQVDTEKLFLYRNLTKNDTSSFNSPVKKQRAENEMKMRKKTAHIGRKASLASEGKTLEKEEDDGTTKPGHRRTWSREERTYEGLAARAARSA